MTQSFNVGVAGAWKVAKPSVGVGGVWKPVQAGFVGVGGAWRQFYSGLTVSLANLNWSVTAFDPDTGTPLGFYTNPAVAATPAGGSGPYTYLWSVVSGSASMDPNGNPTMTFAAVTNAPIVVQCVVTDTVTGATATAQGTIS